MLKERNQADASNYADVEILGKTGQTVIYVFPSGNAQVERGKVAAEQPQIIQTQPKLDQQDAMAASTPEISLSPLERLVEAGLLTVIQKEVVQYDQAATGMTVEEILVARGWFDEASMVAFLN